MIAAYLILAERILHEMDELTRVIGRAERAIKAARQRTEDQDLLIDSAALNLHDFYAGLERIFQNISTTVDGELPTGANWHRQLMHQMQYDLPALRPPVLSPAIIDTLDEYRRFRHVVRNIYAFEFKPEQIERLVNQLLVMFPQLREELIVFTDFLRQVGED